MPKITEYTEDTSPDPSDFIITVDHTTTPFGNKKVKLSNLPVATDALLGANNLSDVDNSSTSRTNLGVAIGSDVQAFDATNVTDASTSTLTNKTLNDPTNTIHADATHLTVWNASGTTITKGSVVYISGFNVAQNKPEISLANASGTATMPAIGSADEDISTGASGHVIISGLLKNHDTSTFTVGDALYVATVAGTVTATKPTGNTELVQAIARVTKVDATLGSVLMQGAGRSNALPNGVDHTTDLLNIGTNTHAQVDTHLAAGNPHASSAASGANTDITSLALADGEVGRPKLKDYAETRVAASGTTTYTCDLENGNVIEYVSKGNVTFTFSNPPASGIAGSFTLMLRQDGTGNRTVTWPASVEWAGGTAPTISTGASALDIFTFITIDGGTTWQGFTGGIGFA